MNNTYISCHHGVLNKDRTIFTYTTIRVVKRFEVDTVRTGQNCRGQCELTVNRFRIRHFEPTFAAVLGASPRVKLPRISQISFRNRLMKLFWHRVSNAAFTLRASNKLLLFQTPVKRRLIHFVYWCVVNNVNYE